LAVDFDVMTRERGVAASHSAKGIVANHFADASEPARRIPLVLCTVRVRSIGF
jgi:hypothetical protein